MPKLIRLGTKSIEGKWNVISKWKCDKCRYYGPKNDVENHEQIHYSKPKLEYIVPDLEDLPIAIVDFDCIDQMKNWRYEGAFPETWEWEGPGRYALYDLGTDHHGYETYRWELFRHLYEEDLDKIIFVVNKLKELIVN